MPEPVGISDQIGQVTYTGGYILPGNTPTGTQTAMPDELVLACLEQVAYWYQRRTQLGLLSVNSDGGSTVQQFQSSDLLPRVRAVLKRYERYVN